MSDSLVLFGTEVKAYEDGTTGGYLVLFNEPDASRYRDVFMKAHTDFDINPDGDVSTVVYHHGMDAKLKRKKIGDKAEIGVDDVGVWIKHQLDLRDKYEAAIHQMAKAGKLGWSSGVPGHLVERKSIDDAAHLVTLWPLGKDASYTPAPADYKNVVGNVKSLAEIESMSLEDAIKSLLKEQPEAQQPEASSEAVGAAKNVTVTTASGSQVDVDLSNGLKMEVRIMSEQKNPPAEQDNNPMKAELDALKSQMETNQNEFTKRLDQVLKFMEDSPMVRQGGGYTVDGGAADSNIKNLGDMLLAVQRGDTKRLQTVYGAIKAQSSVSGPAGGFLIPEATLTELLGESFSMTSGVNNLIREIPVMAPAGRAPIRDYSVVPSDSGQSASAAGVSGQKRQEAGSYGSESMGFEFLRYEVTDFCSGELRASYELVQDAPQIATYLREAIREDVANKKEYAVLRGSGAGQPLGVLNWGGRVQVTEDTDNTFAAADMDEMVSRLQVFDASRVAWVYQNFVYTQVAALERGTGGAVMHNIKDALPNFLSGYPQFKSQHLPAIGTDGYNILGDWSRYFLFNYGGLYIRYSEQRYIDNGQVAWFFGERLDGRPAQTSALTLADGTSTISPFVVIKNKT